MSYFRSINQQVEVATYDTSNLAVNQIFTGATYSTLGVNAIQVNLKADQNCTIYVDQGPADGTWNIQDAFNYYSGLGGTGFTTQATDAYTRVRVKNIGTASTTNKTVSMVLCPIVEALPRALSPEGNLKTGVYEIEGDFGTKVLVSPNRALKMAESYRLVGTALSGSTVDSNFWVTSTTGSGTVTQLNGEMFLSDGTTAASTALVTSKRRARYVPAHTNYYRGQVNCPKQTGFCNRRWGAYDSTNGLGDGYIYNYDGTNLNLLTRKNGSDSTIANGTFNGHYGSAFSLPTLDGTCNTYEIYWTNKSVGFFINDELLHKTTADTSTLVSTPHLQVSAECVNGAGNTANNQLVFRAMTINRLGLAETSPAYAYASTLSASTVVLKYGPGRLISVVINQLSGNNADRLTLYDGTSAVNAFSIFNTNQVASIGAIQYHLDFYNGLSYVFNGTGGTPNCTIVYE
jgi:hypothetical protein